MNRIIDFHKNFHDEITTGSKSNILEYLDSHHIGILTGFIGNIELAKEFYSTFYSNKSRRIVLCGINPGRFGAGETGIPFVDFKSMSKLLPHVNNQNQELSAQFIWSVVSHFGAKNFFDNVYLTNISWFGFINNNSNFNYYDLDAPFRDEFISGFIKEMEIVNPKVIIPLSAEVDKSLKYLKKKHSLNWIIKKRLNHPYYYSNFPSRRDEGLSLYKNTIQSLL